MTPVVRHLLRGVRAIDRRFSRRGDERRLLVNARTPMNFTMVAPVFRALRRDPRITFYFTASEEPARIAAIYHEAPDVPTIHPAHAAFLRCDAYIASDFMWTNLIRETQRIQIFHGVGGKYGFDAPDRSMREWHRLFFINERRLRNFIAHGAIDADSRAIRLVGMPKVDCLVDGTFRRDDVLSTLGLEAGRPTVLYAPTWSPASSLNALGTDLVKALGGMPVNVIIKLHDRSRDLHEFYSGGVDWATRLQPLLRPGQIAIAPGHDISPYLVASDVMITDHSSAGFEFLLRDRPLVRIHRPALIKLAHIHPDYVGLLTSASHSVEDVAGAVAAVDRGLADPAAKQQERRRVAAELFYKPGSATTRAVRELYDVLGLAPSAAVLQGLRRQASEDYATTTTVSAEPWPKLA